jgi:hypothetical protein
LRASAPAQILFECVGREYCDRYFPHTPFDESLLRPPHLLPQVWLWREVSESL